MVLTIIQALLVFSLIIFVHELGHFLTARWFGVTVHEFALGMGPALWKKQGKETLYSLRLFPIGGFCRMEGEDEESADPGSFSQKKPVPRIVILAAGATMNLILGFLIVFGLVLTSAIPAGGLPSTIVDTVEEDSSAAAFLQPGDRIVAVNDTKIHIRRDLSLALSQAGNRESTLILERNGDRQTHSFVPMEVTYEDGTKGYMIGFTVTRLPLNPFYLIHEAFFQTVWMGKLVFLSLGMLLSGKAGLGDLSGPVGVVTTMNTVAQSGWMNFLFFGAFLAVNIGIMNLLPLPALDGGRIFFTLIEMITRRKIPPEKEGWVHGIGLLLLLLLMVFVTYQDIIRIISG